MNPEFPPPPPHTPHPPHPPPTPRRVWGGGGLWGVSAARPLTRSGPEGRFVYLEDPTDYSAITNSAAPSADESAHFRQ